MSDPHAGVLAVLLTFDSPEVTKRCVDLIQRQSVPPAEILVVDSNSAVPPDLAALQQAGPVRVRLLRLAENLGPAGGHAAGLSEFLESGFGYAWEMNDTVEPDEDCLARLLAEMDRHGGRCHVHPAMYNRRTGAREDHWGFYGVLIPRAAVEDAGVPNAELIFGFEDTEYLRDRIWRAGFPGIRAEAATVRVALREKNVRRPAWKYYYQTRNFVFMYLYRRRHIPAGTRVKSLSYWLYREVIRILRIEDNRLKKLGYFALGVYDGLRGRLGLRVRIVNADRPWALRS